MNENILLQIKQIENKIERLKVQKDFYQQLLQNKNRTREKDENL